MFVFRIERQKYLREILTGSGAALSSGNRWNNFQTPMVYASASRSLAMLEVLTRIVSFEDLPSDRYLVTLEIPDQLDVEQLPLSALSENWDSFPAPSFTRELGDQFIRSGKHPVMQVPSSLVKEEYNFLINPFHKKSAAIRIHSVLALDLNRWRRTILP
jgi:RES domain-containing protein